MAHAFAIIECCDEYLRLESRMISQNKAREEDKPLLNPLTIKEETYFYELEAAREVTVYMMEVARNADRRYARESGYRAAAREAQKALNKKPDDPLLPW